MKDGKDGDTRERILHAAAALLAESGSEPVSTRAICQAAGVGAPTLYHHFGDKRGLLEAVAAHGFETYVAEKRAMLIPADPLKRLRDGWDLHVEFGLKNPALYVVMYGSAPSGHRSAAARESERLLLEIVTGIARAGRLTVPPEVAARMVHAAGVGVVLTLINDPDAAGGDLSSRTREAMIAAITTAEESTGSRPLAAQAMALRAELAAASADDPLSPAERALLAEWLERLAAPGR
ncbi:TetR/AcrR family transcriptional regulator [Actinomadura miaoliensis]|uniref:TetR/AcrR family transcriptional regulator n=1 Tax=Actinomadura miaoliensis TaxID=430685 RepID=A0ABP7VTZ5_9ACTN